MRAGGGRDAAIALALAGVVLASRIPFGTQLLWAWDSVLYARALEKGFHVDFSLDEQRPQPPGYIFYVAAAAFARLIFPDSNAALVSVSIVASALSAAALFLLARRFASLGVALIVAAAFAFNPLVWMYAEVAYPYALLALLSIALAFAFHTAHGARGTVAVVASVAFGLATGFRQDLVVLLGPLWLWMLWPHAWRVRVLAAIATCVAMLAWLVPSAALSGGLAEYLGEVSRQSDSVSATYSVAEQGAPALWNNLRFTAYALAWGLLGYAVLLAAGVIAAASALARAARWRPTAAQLFFALWAAPALAFYVVVHIGEWGYVLSVLPALYALAAAIADRIFEGARRTARAGLLAAGVLSATVPALLFVAMPVKFSAAELRAHDHALLARTAYVRRHFAPERTIVLAREDYLLVQYYLPEYRAWLYDPEPHRLDAPQRKRMIRADTLVVFTEGVRPLEPLAATYVEVARNVHIAHFSVEPGAVIEIAGERYRVREPFPPAR